MYPHLTVKMRNEAGIFSQEDVFTVAGARAIRDGANLNQVVNARAGMSAADTQVRGRISAKGRKQTRDVYGQQLYITSEGATKSGVAHKAMRERFSYAEGGKKLVRPARAGMSPSDLRFRGCARSPPRASGDEPWFATAAARSSASAPRERG